MKSRADIATGRTGKSPGGCHTGSPMGFQVGDLGASTAWLPPARRSGSGPIVACFAPAGAGAGFYRDWSRDLPDFRMMPVQLPGREERFGEPVATDARAIATAVADALAMEGAGAPILLGYSFGALLAFETARTIESRGGRVRGVVACARAAPQMQARPSMADRPDGPLLDYVRSLGGLPPEILTAPEFLSLLLPTLRADFWANDRYAATAEIHITAPIVAVVGEDDPATADGRADGWADRTRHPRDTRRVPGGHFFVSQNRAAAFVAIGAALAGLAEAPPIDRLETGS